MSLRWSLVVLLVATTFAVARPAEADAAPASPAVAAQRVAIVGLEATDPVALQLAVELESLGLEVVYAPAWDGARSFAGLSAVARELDVAAAVFVLADELPAADLVVVDRVTGKASQRTVEVDASLPPDLRTRVLVSRAIELLRASLRELEAQESPPPEREVAPSPELRELSRPPPARLVLAATGGLTLSTVGGAPVALLSGTARYRLVPRLALELAAAAPLVSHEVVAEEGSARVWPGLALLSLLHLPARAQAPWQPWYGVGGGVVHVVMDGDARFPNRSARAHVDVAAAGVTLGSSWRIVRPLWARAALRAGLTLPEVEVVFADRTAATWGRPFGDLSLGLEVEVE